MVTVPERIAVTSCHDMSGFGLFAILAFCDTFVEKITRSDEEFFFDHLRKGRIPSGTTHR